MHRLKILSSIELEDEYFLTPEDYAELKNKCSI